MRIEKLVQGPLGLFDSRLCDLFGIGQIGRGAIDAASNIANTQATNAINWKINKATNASNERINAATNAANISMNDANNALQRDLAEAANDLNLQMFHEQNEWNENMWEKEMAYNDPAAQMKRLVDAGINPNLVSGGSAVGSSGAGNASPAPNSASWNGAEVPVLNPSQVEAYYRKPWEAIPTDSSLLGSLLTAANVDNVNADTDNKKNDSVRQILENNALPDKLMDEDDLREWNILLTASAYDLNLSKKDTEKVLQFLNAWSGEEKRRHTLYIEEQTKAYSQITKATIAQINQSVNESRARVRELNKQIDVLDSQVRVNDSVANLNNSLAAESESRTKLNNNDLSFKQETFTDRVNNAKFNGIISEEEAKNLVYKREEIKAGLIEKMNDLDLNLWEKTYLADFLIDNEDVSFGEIVDAMKYFQQHPTKVRQHEMNKKAFDAVSDLLDKSSAGPKTSTSGPSGMPNFKSLPKLR